MPDEMPEASSSEPVPNSEGRLAALARWNPASAEFSKCVLQEAGRIDVCALCGDEDSEDYRILDPESSPCPVKVFRLCAECATIRNQMGERWALWGC